jgi:hypothetical protein
MRLVLALLFAAALSALTTVMITSGQKNETDEYALQSVEQEKNHAKPDSSNGQSAPVSDDNRSDRWTWLWQAISSVLIFVLAGWGVGRLSMQFRKVIAIFIALVLVFDFVLVQIGVVEFRLRWENVEQVFQAFKRIFIAVGFVPSVSILVGLWAGVSGYLSAERRQKAVTNAA